MANRNARTFFIIAASTMATATAAASEPAGLRPPAEIKILVSHAAGGAYDLYARLVSRHLPKHLPGSPTAIVQNMPGASGVAMTNYLATTAVRDGSVFGVGPGSLATAALFGSPGAKYDARQLTWIGSLNSDVVVATAWHTAAVKSIDDLFRSDLVVAGVGATDNSVIYPTLLNRLLGTRFRLISGYKGSGETVLALERGEVEGIGGWSYASLQSLRPQWVAEGKLKILVQFSLTPHPDLTTVPTILTYAKTDDQRDVLRLILTQLAIGRVIVGPPGLTGERTEALRAAVSMLFGDQDFRRDAAQANLELNQPRPGDEVERLVAALHEVSPATVALASDAIGGTK